ncbi:MAG: SIMPL domain-containing protein [Chloroflexi bacterium]|nr:SIMPL domain-containing protein [Chloroflexota bacterium]
MNITQKPTIMALLAGALAFAVACSQATPTPTPPGATPIAPGNGAPPPTGGGSPLITGGSSVEAAGYSYYTAPQASYGSPQTGIWVGGSGRVVITPDLATLSLGVESRSKTVEQARAEAAQAMSAVMDVLKKNGIADKDIRTEYFNIQPEYVWNDFSKRQEITGYRVSNSLSVKSRNLDGVGALIDAVSLAGGDLVRINGISFSAEHPETYAGQAREAAVKDAMAKAQQFATLTGVKLGKLVYISETGGNVPVYQDYAKGMIAAAEAGALPPTPISPGETEVTITVQAVFGIE